MRKFLAVLLVFVMAFGNISAFAQAQDEPEYNTSISGDVNLNLNDDWQLGFTIDTEAFLLRDSIINRMYFQVYANIHLTGNTDAKALKIQSAAPNSSTHEIEIDSNGNFDQEVKLVLAEFSSINNNIIDFEAYITAFKGDKTVKVKIGKGELETNLVVEDLAKEIDIDNDGINSLDFARFKNWYLDCLQEEYSKMEDQESIKAYIYNEWYMKSFVVKEDGAHFNAQTHLRVKTDAEQVILDIDDNSKQDSYDYSEYREIDEIIEVSGVVPLSKSSDTAAYARIKASKGNRVVELGSPLKESQSGNAIVGDINTDESVNSLDFALLRKYLLGKADRFPVQSGFYSADVNDDKKINSMDYALLRMYLLGKIDSLPKNSSTDITPTPTPTPIPSNIIPYTTYKVNNVNVDSYSGVDIYVDKSHKTKISISANTLRDGLNDKDRWEKTYFRLSGSAVNGVDYEEIDFDYFWRRVGNPDYDIDLGDSNPRIQFFITPIDTGSNETKYLEIYFENSNECAATIHFVKGLSNVEDKYIAKHTPEPNNDYANYYKPDSIISTLCYGYDQVTFYTRNVLAEKSGNPTSFPSYYQPDDIFFIEETNPTHLNIIKNPPVCDFPVTISNTIYGLKPYTKYYYGSQLYNIEANWFRTREDYSKPSTRTPKPTPSIPVTPTPTNLGMTTYYKVNNIDINKYPGVEIYVEKSSTSKIWVSASTVCTGPFWGDGWIRTPFSLSGSAVNGVDYEEIDFDYFWRILGSNIGIPPEDDNPREGFYITPIDTGTDETKDLEIYLGGSNKPAAIIHFVKSVCNLEDTDRAKEIEPISDYQNSYTGETRTSINTVEYNRVKFRSQNFIYEKRGNPLSYPTYYQPKDIYYMEEGVPSSLKVIKNPPISNLPVVIYNNVTDLKPNTTYVYGNALNNLTENEYSGSPKTFTTPSNPFSGPGGSITYYTVAGRSVSPGSCTEITVEKSPENKIWVSARSECYGGLLADGWTKTEFKLSGSAVNGVDYEKIDFDYFWSIIGSDLYVPPPDSNPQRGFYITPIDTDSDEEKYLEIYLGSSNKPAAIIHFVEKSG